MATRRHTAQTELSLPPTPRRARRRRMGRPPKQGQHDSPHRPRLHVTRHQPVHVVFRVCEGVGRLRRGRVYKALLRAFAYLYADATCRIVHASIQHNHLHLIVEADSTPDLARGMQRFAISAARAINRVQQRSGKVFAYRYHATRITTPRQARHALAYVLNNWRRHREDHATGAALDPFASGLAFHGWSPVTRSVVTGADRVPLPVSPARCWLLTTGWRRHGLISPGETPSLGDGRAHPHAPGPDAASSR